METIQCEAVINLCCQIAACTTALWQSTSLPQSVSQLVFIRVIYLETTCCIREYNDGTRGYAAGRPRSASHRWSRQRERRPATTVAPPAEMMRPHNTYATRRQGQRLRAGGGLRLPPNRTALFGLNEQIRSHQIASWFGRCSKN